MHDNATVFGDHQNFIANTENQSFRDHKCQLKEGIKGRPSIAGHRGFGYRKPENTLEAFQMAKNFGLDWIEFDVHLTKDKDVVV